MKFLCSNCKAKYQIADEKVAGRTLRMTCRRCQQEIVIRGEPSTPSEEGGSLSFVVPTPSPLGTDFSMQVASSMRPSMRPSMGPHAVSDEWHVAIQDVPVGPIRREDIARKLLQNAIDLESLAWCEGMDDWRPIRQIPELARLSMPPAVAPLPPPPLALPPAPRPAAASAQLSQFGGRAAVSPYPADPWAGAAVPAAQQERASQIVVNPLLESGAQQRSLPSWPVMFALAGGFAFLMSAVAILGARFLNTPQVVATAPAGTAGAAAVPAQPVQPVLELPEEQAAVPESGEPNPVVEEGAAAAQAPRPGTRPRTGLAQVPGKTNKPLTAEQKAMLARMGGETNTNLSNLQGSSTETARPRATGSLSGADVSKVVLRGRKNLQRCYETALRGTGSDDTVRMDVELTVTPSGNVTNVRTSGDGLPGMAPCIERTVKMWRFPASDDSSPVKFPLLFQPGA